MATNANTSAYFAPESSPQSGFLCTFTSTVSPSTITPGTPGVTVSGTDTCDPSGSYLYAALLPGNPKLVDYLSDPCDSIESAISKGTYGVFPSANGPTNNAWNYAEIIQLLLLLLLILGQEVLLLLLLLCSNQADIAFFSRFPVR